MLVKCIDRSKLKVKNNQIKNKIKSIAKKLKKKIKAFKPRLPYI